MLINIVHLHVRQNIIYSQQDINVFVAEQQKNRDAKYLGVTVSDDLEWTKHINAISRVTN